MNLDACPTCNSKLFKRLDDPDTGAAFWVKFACHAVFERSNIEGDWHVHSPCLGKPKALVLSSDDRFIEELREALIVDSVVASTTQEASKLFSQVNINRVITDLYLPGEDVPRFFSMLKNLMPSVKIVLCLPSDLAFALVSKQFTFDKGIQSSIAMKEELNNYLSGDKEDANQG